MFSLKNGPESMRQKSQMQNQLELINVIVIFNVSIIRIFITIEI